MTLLEYIRQSKDDEVEVYDEDYDIVTYFYKNDNNDCWDRAMNRIASRLEVVEFGSNGVVVDLSKTIEKAMDKMDDLFIINDIDAIMIDIEAILSGCVSEEWLTKFAERL